MSTAKAKMGKNNKDKEEILEGEIVRESITFLDHHDATQQGNSKDAGRLWYLQEEQVRQAERTLQVALDRFRQFQNQQPEQQQQPKDLESVLIPVREAYEDLQYWDDALNVEILLYEQVYEPSSTSDRMAAADSLYRQGKFQMRLQHETKASLLYQQALDVYETAMPEQQQQQHASKGQVYISLAGVAFHRGRFAEALDILQQQAKPHFLHHNNNDQQQPHPDIVKCLQHEGLIYRTMEDFHKALDSYKEAWQIYQSLHKSRDRITTQSGEEKVRDDSDNDDLQMAKRQGMLLDIADMHMALDDLDSARAIYEQLLEQDRAAVRQRNKALAAQLGSSTDKKKKKNTTMEQTSALQGVMLHNLGRIYSFSSQQQPQAEDLKKALVLLQEALQIKEYWSGRMHPEVGKTLTALGTVHARLARHPDGKAGADTDQANVYTAQDHYLAAKNCFQRALLITRMVSAASTQRHQHASTGNDENSSAAPAEDPEVMLALHNLQLLNEQRQQQQQDEQSSSAASTPNTTTAMDSSSDDGRRRRKHFLTYDDDNDSKEEDQDSLSDSSSSSSSDDDDETNDDGHDRKNAVMYTDSDSSDEDDNDNDNNVDQGTEENENNAVLQEQDRDKVK